MKKTIGFSTQFTKVVFGSSSNINLKYVMNVSGQCLGLSMSKPLIWNNEIPVQIWSKPKTVILFPHPIYVGNLCGQNQKV